jgi:hypothetical protein
MLCGHCQQPGEKLLQCSGCQETSYCCPEHQASDWKSHKGLCKQRRKEKVEREKKAAETPNKPEAAPKNDNVEMGMILSQINKARAPPEGQAGALVEGGNSDLRTRMRQSPMNKTDHGGCTALYVASQV